MKRVIFLDTHFLVNNIGKINEIANEFKEKEFDVYIPVLVKEEFINIQLRKLENAYNEIECYKQNNPVMELKYKEKEESIKIIEDLYNKKFDETFKDKIISYNKKTMLDRVLERNRYKKPPFNKDSGSSYKGFKDTIILLSIMDFIDKYTEEVEFYFITSDNGFTKQKSAIEKEIIEKYKNKFTIIDGNDKSKLYKEINIEVELEIEKEDNVFYKKDINVDEIRNKINKLMDSFIFIETIDNFGNEEKERRFDLNKYITVEKTERFLDNIDKVIAENIFRNEIHIELFFENDVELSSYHKIDTYIVKEISEIYKLIKTTEYKEALINYISERINENRIFNIFDKESPEELPF